MRMFGALKCVSSVPARPSFVASSAPAPSSISRLTVVGRTVIVLPDCTAVEFRSIVSDTSVTVPAAAALPSRFCCVATAPIPLMPTPPVPALALMVTFAVPVDSITAAICAPAVSLLRYRPWLSVPEPFPVALMTMSPSFERTTAPCTNTP